MTATFHFRDLPELAKWCEARSKASLEAKRLALNQRRSTAAAQRVGEAAAFRMCADLIRSSMVGHVNEIADILKKRKPSKLTNWNTMTESLAAEICDKLRGL